MKGATICAEMSLVVNVYFNKADNKNYISVINSEMSLVVNVFFNKADNKNYISVTNSYSVGKEILGAKANECQECDSPRPPSTFQSPPLLQSPNQSSSRPSAPPSDQPQPPSPPYTMPTNPPYPAFPPSPHPAPNQSQSTSLHSAPLYTESNPPHLLLHIQYLPHYHHPIYFIQYLTILQLHLDHTNLLNQKHIDGFIQPNQWSGLNKFPHCLIILWI